MQVLPPIRKCSIIELLCEDGRLSYTADVASVYEAWQPFEELYNPRGYTTGYITITPPLIQYPFGYVQWRGRLSGYSASLKWIFHRVTRSSAQTRTHPGIVYDLTYSNGY